MEMNAMRMRSRSMEYIDENSEDSCTVSPDYWISNRSRSLPRNLDQSGRRYSGKENRTLDRASMADSSICQEIRERRCFTDRVKRRAEHEPDISRSREGLARSETLVRKSKMKSNLRKLRSCSMLKLLKLHIQ